MGDTSVPLQQIHTLRAAAASGRSEDMRGALAGMSPVVAQVGQALVAADRGDWDGVIGLLAGISNVPWALDGMVSLALTRALNHTDQLEKLPGLRRTPRLARLEYLGLQHKNS